MRYLGLGLLLIMAVPVMADAPLRVGVIGMITALDPVQINGLTLDIGPDMPVISPLGPRSGKTLRLGHTLAITLEDAADGWVIKRALHIYPLVGPVTEVEGDALTVMGSQVIGLMPGMFDGIKPGNWVGVSGFWKAGVLVASRAGTIPATGFAQLSGSYVEAEDDTSNAMIGGTEIIGTLNNDTATGDMWVLGGTAEKTALRVGLKSARLFLGQVDVVLAQGYVSAPIASETFTLLGTGLIGFAKEADMPDNSDLSIFCGLDGKILREVPQVERLADLVLRLDCLK